MRRGRVVLAPFPFTDLSAYKARPAVVVSRGGPSSDVILAFVATYRGQALTAADVLIEGSDPEYALTGFRVSSLIRVDKLITLETSILLGEVGELSTNHLQRLDDALRYVLDL